MYSKFIMLTSVASSDTIPTSLRANVNNYMTGNSLCTFLMYRNTFIVSMLDVFSKQNKYTEVTELIHISYT